MHFFGENYDLLTSKKYRFGRTLLLDHPLHVVQREPVGADLHGCVKEGVEESLPEIHLCPQIQH